MNKLLKALTFGAVLFAVTTSQASAENTVTIKGAGYGGNGCPNDSASVTVSPDGQVLTILFDKYIADASKPSTARKSCNLSIPIFIPNGFQISLYDAEYRGYVAPNTRGTLRSEYFFAGGRGPVFQSTFNGETNYDKQDSLATVANVWSSCGASVNMRVNTSLRASGEGIATVDSFDLTHRGLVYHIKYRNCQ
ncbi:hypothetical protein Syn7502_01178 [Synechococcus sp. PCC 7502]|uniref:DUF4360 domain-containing protein n=1 Tax=Synechococcus sp. PCC 7502 TaxID=1173263 RepID=UPI00029FFFBA|nr:DUF4360 domain-containing protein [Synechococcus sp. PCC 7502]AFY73281.1 hypothetical protein Syn7502_01178 [Synechococcus sp. PCC 7502]